MWIETYSGILVNTDKLASIQKSYDWYYDGTATCGIYGTGTINYLGDHYKLDKNSICLFSFLDKNAKKVEYIYNHIFKELMDSFSHNTGFICIPELTEKYSTEFDEIKE